VGGQRNPPSDHKDKIVDFCPLALPADLGAKVAANLGKEPLCGAPSHNSGIRPCRVQFAYKVLLWNVKLPSISDLATNPRNARTHSPRQIQEIARSIERFGFNNPVLIDERNQIIAGHGRVEAAKLLGRERVPTLRIGHLSDQDKRAFIIADNRLAEKAGWDPEILAIELQGLIELDFDVESIGFSIPEVEMILDAASPPANNAADDEIPDVTPNRIISKPNDLWILGEHRLICGDARSRSQHCCPGRPLSLFLLTHPTTYPFAATSPARAASSTENLCRPAARKHPRNLQNSSKML
jgi:hypothetical protein